MKEMPPDIVFRPALYLGSIPFESDNLSRAAFVRNKLEVLQNFSFFKPVTLCISTSGVKVCDPDCKNVYMAHALRRISCATCDSFTSKFAFLAREATCAAPSQYCHVFATDTKFQAEELNAIIGDAFKLAYAKQRMQQSTKSITSMDSHEPLPPLSSLHPVQLQLSVHSGPDLGTEEKGGMDNTPPLHIPPPPPTSPSPPPQDISPQDGVGKQYLEETSCNGKPRWASTGLQRHWLADSGRTDVKNSSTMLTQALDNADGGQSVGARQRALSDPRTPCPVSSLQFPTPQTPTSHLSQAQQPPLPSVRHSVAFFDTPTTPRLSVPPSNPLPPASPDLIKDKNRAIFDLPLGDQPLLSTAASPVVALKAHLDSLANGSKKPSSSNKKSDSSFPHISSSSALASGTSAVVSRFRLRQAGGGGGGGAKKRQLERPLSQIICQLDSALLLNNSPSFSIQQPRSEERLSVAVNHQLTVTQVSANTPEGYDEDDVVEGIPRAVVQCLDALDNPPIPPMRVHSLRRGAGEIFGHFSRSSSSETASPHGSRSSRSGRAPLQSLSESSDFEKLNSDPSNDRNSTEIDEDDAEAVEFAILEAAAEAEEQAAAAAEQKHSQLGDICPVPPLADPVVACRQQPPPQTSDNVLVSGGCSLHSGLEPSSFPLHNGDSHHGNSHHHQQHFRSTDSGGNCGTSSRWPSSMDESRSQQQHQLPQTECSSRWTGETPTPTATPTPTPTPANLLPNAHQHIHQQQTLPPPWFQAYLPREVALELLTHEETGSFLVRDSVTQPGCWALSVRVPAQVNCMGITHYLIQRSKNGVKLKGLNKEWPSLDALITHLTVIPEMLPCPLRLPPTAQYPGHQQQHQASNPTFIEEEEDLGGGEPEDEEYQRLSDFSSMLADMQPATTVASTSMTMAPRLFRY